MKRILLLLLLTAIFPTTGCAGPAESPIQAPETVLFTDSLGREVEIPAEIEKYAVTGPLAQIVLFALAPEGLAGLAVPWDAAAESYLATGYYNLPTLGQLYGGKGELNLETLLSSEAQLIIDLGEAKEDLAADLDALQDQVGLPFIHIAATLDDMGQAYRLLGQVLDRQKEAEILAAYCEEVYSRGLDVAASVDKKSLLYCLGDQGLNVIAAGSYHAGVLDLLADNVARVAAPSGKGTGNEADLEQLMLWDPEAIIFSPDSVYHTVGADPAWREMSAVKSGRYYQVPYGPYNWLGFPPSVQQYLGLLWLAQLLYPETANYDMYAEAVRYYRLFYHTELSQEQYQDLVANSLGKL